MTRTVPFRKSLLGGGALAIAAVAYALGTQAGGGTAGAATQPVSARPAPAGATGASGPFGGWHHPRFGATGASGPFGGFGHPRFGGGRFGPGRFAGGGQMLASAARDLGVTEAQLTSALMSLRGTLRPDVMGAKQDFAAALASSLGLDESKVAAALQAQRAAGPPFGGWRHGAGSLMDTSALATALGVDQARLDAAVKATFQQEAAKLRTELVDAVAAKLGLSDAKVAAVAEKYLPKGFGPRP